MLNKIKVALEPGAYPPKRAHEEDAGMDLKTPKDFTIDRIGRVNIHTGVHVEIPKGYTGLVISKSGLNSKKGITTVGVIDSGYTGEIVVTVRNNEAQEAHFHAGDKISQLVIVPVETPAVEVVSLDEINGGDRGNNGFGSTGA